MVAIPRPAHAAGGGQSFVQQVRIVRILATTSFKLRYADSALGYFWTIARPLALFGILYVVFGRAIGIGLPKHYPLFLLIGIVLFTFFQEATTRTMSSIVDQSQLLRRVAFPRLIVPTSVSLTAVFTLGLNLAAVAAFLIGARVVPAAQWLVTIPLLLELYIFVLGLSLILTTLYARLRDVGAIWEVITRVFFYAAGVIFPLQLLPSWAERVVLLNPFTQVMQDFRAAVLYDVDITTTSEALGTWAAYLVPIGLTLATFAFGLWLFKRNEHWFAEQA